MTPLGAVEEERESFPEWYLLTRAAQYLGVAPWELAKQPAVWMHWALAAMSAEARAEKTRMDRQKAKSKAPSRKR
jgi:non-ribosomal peptide synthetase component F